MDRERKLELIEAVQRALSDALKLPSDDRCVRLFEYDDDSTITPPGKGSSYMVVEVPLFSGRTDDAERRLCAGLARELSPRGIPRLRYQNHPRRSAGLRLGASWEAASDIDLGYKIDV